MSTQIKICKVCKREYEAYAKAYGSTMKSKTPRRSNSLTCSPECSKKIEYNKWYNNKKEANES